jgi:hypothetical protein
MCTFGSQMWGSLTPYGQFALATGGPDSVFLERCGTRMQRLLVYDSAVLPSAIVTPPGSSRATGVLWLEMTLGRALFGGRLEVNDLAGAGFTLSRSRTSGE